MLPLLDPSIAQEHRSSSFLVWIIFLGLVFGTAAYILGANICTLEVEAQGEMNCWSVIGILWMMSLLITAINLSPIT